MTLTDKNKDETEVQMVAFMLDKEEFAINILQVREV